MKRLFAVAAFALLATGVAQAGDANAGKTKSAVCAACHGADGNSATPIWPKLAGQGEAYLAKQLADFRTGAQSEGKKGRFEPTMAPMAAGLSDADIADLSAYFASQKVQYAGVKKEYVEAGRKLYTGGDASRGIPACTACHGGNGAGMAGAKYPALGGQHVDYTIAQLKAFRDGKRANDPNGMMQGVVKNMSDEQITAIANYLVGLH